MILFVDNNMGILFLKRLGAFLDSFGVPATIQSKIVMTPFILESQDLETVKITMGGNKLKPSLAESINILSPSIMDAKKLKIEIIESGSLETSRLEYVKKINEPEVSIASSILLNDNIKEVSNLIKMLYNTIVEVKKAIENSERIKQSKLTGEPEIKGK